MTINFILICTGDKWVHDRKLITPSFHFNILENFVDVMTEKTEILNNRIKHHIKTKPNEPLNFFEYAVECAMDIICGKIE